MNCNTPSGRALFYAYLDDSPQFYPKLASTVSPSRWPTFAADATEMGAHALFAFPIPDGQQPLGVLELYRRSTASIPFNAPR